MGYPKIPGLTQMTGILVLAIGGRPQLLRLDHTIELLKHPRNVVASVPRVDGQFP